MSKRLIKLDMIEYFYNHSHIYIAWGGDIGVRGFIMKVFGFILQYAL